MICVIDNYDSFTYNLVQILLKNGFEVEVYKNDQITLPELQEKAPNIQAFLLSPGPGHPDASGICRDLVKTFYKEKPILGICLGHQILAQFFGAKIIPAPRIMHGKISEIAHDNQGIFQGMPQLFKATRYHSLIVDKETLPPELEISCWTLNSEGKPYELMGFRHLQYRLAGLQFHPESVMTPEGERLVLTFFK